MYNIKQPKSKKAPFQ